VKKDKRRNAKLEKEAVRRVNELAEDMALATDDTDELYFILVAMVTTLVDRLMKR
jgi:hypothetical protein